MNHEHSCCSTVNGFISLNDNTHLLITNQVPVEKKIISVCDVFEI